MQDEKTSGSRWSRWRGRENAGPISPAQLFAPVFLAVYLLHWTLLRLPYFWDEGGYYIPAAWDFLRLGTLIPKTTMTNAHPPLPSILLAAWWKLAGFHVVSTRIFVCMVAALALVGVFRLARLLAKESVGFAVMVLTAVYPVWFAQSSLAHADVFAAVFTIWGLSYYVDRPGWRIQAAEETEAEAKTASNAISAGVLFSLAALSKETAIVIPAGLFLYEAMLLFRSRGRAASTGRAAYLAALAFPVLPLAGWYAYHHAMTGFTFGNPEYLRYNATANLSAMRVLLSLRHRLVHLSIHMELFVPLLLTLAVLLVPRRAGAKPMARGALGALGTVIAVHWIAFSVLGGALLTRYLMPAYPLLLLIYVATWRDRVKQWGALAALTLAGFAAGCEVNPPYPFAPEDNLAYRDMIVLHQEAIWVLQDRYPGATVLTAWPVAADLQRPELGYVRTPMRTTEIRNFTREEVAKAAAEPGNYDTALVFSTKYNPPPGGLNWATAQHASDAEYFDAHRDLLPAEVAASLGGTVVWQTEHKGQWAAVLHFRRSYEARKPPTDGFPASSGAGKQEQKAGTGGVVHGVAAGEGQGDRLPL